MMEEKIHRRPAERDELDLFEILRYCGANWRTLAKAVGLGLLLGLVVIWVIPPEYSATVVVAPAPDESGSSSGLSSALSQVSAGAEMLGISLPGGGKDDKFKEFVVLLTSARLAQKMIATNDPRPVIYHRIYDPQTHSFPPPTGILGALRAVYAFVLRQPPWEPPGAWDLGAYLKDHLSVTSDTKTGFISITYSHKNKAFAGAFVTQVVATADNILRSERKTIAENKIIYFNKRLQVIQMDDSRRAIIGLLSNEEKTLAIIDVNAPYAAKILMPTIVSARPTFPNLFITLIGGMFLGLFCALCYLIWNFIHKKDAEPVRTASSQQPAYVEMGQFLPSKSKL